MKLVHCRLAVALLGLLGSAFVAHSQDGCADVQRALEATVKEYPEKAAEALVAQLRNHQECAGPLVTSAIMASRASDELVAELVTAAVRTVPDKAIVIAESAIVAAPSASDEVAEVIQSVLGDCRSISEDVALSIGRNRDRLLVIVEDALRRHGNCACEIVGAAVRVANGSEAVVSQIVETAVKVKPALVAEISECATAAAPNLAAAVQVGVDRALNDGRRGSGALPASAEVSEDEVRATETADATAWEDPGLDESTVTVDGESASASAGTEGYGKQGSPKNGKQPAPIVQEEEDEEEWGWDWIHWGSLGGNGGAAYMILPAGGVIPPGFAPPLSPSDPKWDPKKPDPSDPKKPDPSDPKKPVPTDPK